MPGSRQKPLFEEVSHPVQELPAVPSPSGAAAKAPTKNWFDVAKERGLDTRANRSVFDAIEREAKLRPDAANRNPAAFVADVLQRREEAALEAKAEEARLREFANGLNTRTGDGLRGKVYVYARDKMTPPLSHSAAARVAGTTGGSVDSRLAYARPEEYIQEVRREEETEFRRHPVYLAARELGHSHDQAWDIAMQLKELKAETAVPTSSPGMMREFLRHLYPVD